MCAYASLPLLWYEATRNNLEVQISKDCDGGSEINPIAYTSKQLLI